MARTSSEFVADIMRECRGQATVLEASQALSDALNAIDQMANWEFLLATKLINLHAPVTDGTVSVMSGSTSVTLSGGTWATSVSPFGEYREIKFGARDLPYKVLSVTNTMLGSSLTLATALSGGASDDITDGTYTLYQARYPLPTDCEPGRDLSLKGPISTGTKFDGNIPKRERLIYDRLTSQIPVASTLLYYTDDEFDEANHSGTFRVEPYPKRTYELRLTYYKTLTVPPLPNTLPIILPVAFERAPILMAAGNILRKKNMQGWQTMRQESGDMLNKLYNRYAASAAYEGKIDPSYADLMSDDPDTFASDNMLFNR